MCCQHSWQAKERALAEFGNRKTRVCWKVLQSTGQSLFGYHQYRPGAHCVKVKRYDRRHPRGIHVFWDKDSVDASARYEGDRIVPVVCHRDDLVVAGMASIRLDVREAVFRKIVIRRAAWEENLPKVVWLADRKRKRDG